MALTSRKLATVEYENTDAIRSSKVRGSSHVTIRDLLPPRPHYVSRIRKKVVYGRLPPRRWRERTFTDVQAGSVRTISFLGAARYILLRPSSTWETMSNGSGRWRRPDRESPSNCTDARGQVNPSSTASHSYVRSVEGFSPRRGIYGAIFPRGASPPSPARPPSPPSPRGPHLGVHEGSRLEPVMATGPIGTFDDRCGDRDGDSMFDPDLVSFWARLSHPIGFRVGHRRGAGERVPRSFETVASETHP